MFRIGKVLFIRNTWEKKKKHTIFAKVSNQVNSSTLRLWIDLYCLAIHISCHRMLTKPKILKHSKMVNIAENSFFNMKSRMNYWGKRTRFPMLKIVFSWLGLISLAFMYALSASSYRPISIYVTPMIWIAILLFTEHFLINVKKNIKPTHIHPAQWVLLAENRKKRQFSGNVKNLMEKKPFHTTWN